MIYHVEPSTLSQVIMNKIARIFKMAIPVVIFVLSSIILLITTALRSVIYWAFDWYNYWDLTNEWNQVVSEFEAWVKYYKTGMSVA